MKKFILMLTIAAVMMTAAACGSGNKNETKAPETAASIAAGETTGETAPDGTPMTKEETNPDNGLPLSKQPDPNRPVLAQISIYAPDANGDMKQVMDTADSLTGENVVNLLISHGTLAEGTKFVSFDTKDSDSTEAAGPGGSSDAKSKTGTLILSGFAAGNGIDEEKAKQAVIDTFTENFELDSLELVLQ